MGKFETGYKGANVTQNAMQNVTDPTKVQIKPNVYSWRNISISKAHLNSYNYQRDLDSHMMKNTEWGSVAYLQHSKYGSMQKVRLNNYIDYKTGYSSTVIPTCSLNGRVDTCNPVGSTQDLTMLYNNSTGYLASTTGNISGVYDLSGGVMEYMMGVIANSQGSLYSGTNSVQNSGFNGLLTCPSCTSEDIRVIVNGILWPEEKYYDTYKLSTLTNRIIAILGDATHEMGPFYQNTFTSPSGLTKTGDISSWYDNESTFTSFSSNPWFWRGGAKHDGVTAGVFSFWASWGSERGETGYRIVLAD